MITVDIGDIMSVVNLISGHLIALAVALVIAIAIVIFACVRLKKPLKGLVNDTDIMLGTTGNDAILTDTTSGTSLQAMRQATKDVFYTTVNSAAYENYVSGAIPTWQMTTYIIEGVVAALAVAAEVLLVYGYLKKKKAA